MKTFLTVVKRPLVSKGLLIMKITTLIMLAFSLQVTAKGLGQSKVSLKFKKTEIAKVLTAIEKQTNFRFLYNNELQGLKQKINVSVEDKEVKQVLSALLDNTGLAYQFLENNLIVIKENIQMLPPLKMTGRVTDENGAALVGVSVMIKGTSKGVTTDEKGNYTINATDKDVLVFSYVGYDATEVKLGTATELNITLKSAAKKALDEVVVVGYGTVRKKDLTGSVISVKGDEVKKVAAANAMESLQGKLPGVDIVRTSGGAGANVSITVRGNRSVNARNEPLFIVDGIQYDSYQDINASDIQSMEVLKDASSTAIYGSRGANGVIIITTKRGSAGKAKITASAYAGVSDVAGYPKPMTGPQYADLKRQAYRTIGTWNSPADDNKVFTSASDLAAATNGTSFYWPGLLLNKGSQQDYNVGISAGTDKTRIYFSFDYLKEKGLLGNDYSNRYTLRLNIDQTLTNTLKAGVQSQLAYYDQNLRSDGILTVANKVIPYFSPYNTDGTLAKFPGNGNQSNPLFEEEEGAYVNQNRITRLLSTAYAEWKPLKDLSIRSNLGITNSSSRNGNFQGANTISRALSTGSSASIANALVTDLTWENIITYQSKFGQHSLGVTGVTSFLSKRSESSSAAGTGQLLASQSFYALQNNPANIVVSSNYTGSNLTSGAFRINYGYKEKYLLTVTGRADGASVLAPHNRWSFFPSVAAAWRVIDEPFMKNQGLFGDLKLRASYGVAGNSSVLPYQTQSALALVPFAWNEQSALAYALDPQIGNPDLHWELTKTLNIALDFSIVKNRISGSFDYYDSKTNDLLCYMPLPATTGGQRVLGNIGKTRNSGFEIALRTENIKTNNFTWNSSISFQQNKERIVFLPNNQDDIAAGLFIGYPVSSFYDYDKLGIWQTKDAALATLFGYKPGDIRVRDVDGSGTITALADRVIVGSAVPRYSLGFSNDFKYRNFDLNVLVFARQGQMFVSAYANKFEPNAIENGANVNYWTPENPTDDYPRPNVNISRAALPFATTLGYKDGSFVKIRNIALGYTLPAELCKKLHIGSLRWYVNARNFITFSKVDDYDPEGAGSFERPLTKLIVTGVTLDF
jgi:TonB-linked SusC/RagA family outer membrane protein